MMIIAATAGVLLCILILRLVWGWSAYKKADRILYNGEEISWDALFVKVAKAIRVSGPVIVKLSVKQVAERLAIIEQAEAKNIPLEVAIARCIAVAALSHHTDALRAKKIQAAGQYQAVYEAATEYAESSLHAAPTP